MAFKRGFLKTAKGKASISIPGSTNSSLDDPKSSNLALITKTIDMIKPPIQLKAEERVILVSLFGTLFPDLENRHLKTKDYLEVVKRMGRPGHSIAKYNIPSRDPRRPPFIWVGYDNMLPVVDELRLWNVPLPVVSPPAYRIGESNIPGAGKGMFATRAIKSHETILVERPILFLVPAYIDEKVLEKMMRDLPAHIRDEYFALTNARSAETEYPSTGIFFTNSFSIDSPSMGVLGQFSCVALQLSRCNHSCAPNASASGHGDKLWIELRANRDIEEGEEITISYRKISKTRKERNEELGYYKFTCRCKFCTLPSDRQTQSDIARTEISDTVNFQFGLNLWLKWLKRPHEGPKDPFIVQMQSQLLSVKNEELYHMEWYYCVWLALAYAALGDKERFLEWAKRTQSAERLVVADVAAFRSGDEWDEWLSDPEKMPIWKIKKN